MHQEKVTESSFSQDSPDDGGKTTSSFLNINYNDMMTILNIRIKL